MRITLGRHVAKQESDYEILAGSAGVAAGESRTNHDGRKALLLVRGTENTDEFCNLVKTMGIIIVEKITQKGIQDQKSYFGKGRLQDVADELRLRVSNHPWDGVDLLLIHTSLPQDSLLQ